MKKTFITLINCMDGRAQIPVNDWLKQTYRADYVDTITEPGPELVLIANDPESPTITYIKKKIEISLNKHGSERIAIAGHLDCAGNPVGEKEKKEQVLAAAGLLRSWYPDVEIIPLFLDEDWNISRI